MAAKSIKNTLKLVRNRALGNISEQIEDLNAKLDRLIVQTTHNGSEVKNEYPVPSIIPVSDEEVIAKIFTGLKMSLDPRDIAVAPHLALDTVWEAPITKAWLRLVKQTGVVFDIGANFGYFGVIAAQRMNQKESKVIMFEPNPNLIPYVDKTISMNWLHQSCHIENLGVSDVNGKAKLTILKDYLGCSSMHTVEHLSEYLKDKMTLEAQEIVEVKTVSLDYYCEQNSIEDVDLIKLDIEGFEDKAYAGMRKIINKSKAPKLFVEFTRESYEDPETFFNNMLADFGIVHTISEEGNLIYQPRPTYKNIASDSDDWIMLVFAKEKLEK
jgi:FkbM family methyltransferase